MKKSMLFISAALISAAATVSTVNSQDNEMSFFITSAGSGDGANLGGLAGADAQCQNLARRRDPGARPGVPISAPMLMETSRRLMPEKESALVPGITPEVLK